jgi:hypothetical protein
MTSQVLARYMVVTLMVASLFSPARAQRRRRTAKPSKPVAAARAAEPLPAPAATAPLVDVPPAANPESADEPGSSAAQAVVQNGPAPTVPDAPPASPASGQEPTAPPAPSDARATEVAALRHDLSAVMDELVQARARVAVLGKALFKTKVRVKIDNRATPDQVVVGASLWLDGSPVWKGDARALADPERTLFEGFLTPGPHVLTLEVAQRAREDATYGYDLRETYHFKALRERRTDLRIVLDDDSDMAEDFADDQEGEYDVRTRLEVHAVALGDE